MFSVSAQKKQQSTTYKQYEHLNHLQPLLIPDEKPTAHGQSNGLWFGNKPAKYKEDSIRDHKLWVCKTIGSINQTNIDSAENETIAQEWFRLFLPTHPKTRYWQSKTAIYVISEKIEGFVSLQHARVTWPPEDFKAKLNDVLQDFAEILIISLWLNEIDLNEGNLGFDKDCNIIKIDGGGCFAAYYYRSKIRCHELNEKDLDDLLQLHLYSPFNWPFTRERGKKISRDLEEIAAHPSFKAGVYRGLAKVVITPNEWIQTFINEYHHPDNPTYIAYNILVKRRDMLLNAALKLLAFQEYRQSRLYQQDINTYLLQLQQFISIGKSRPWLARQDFERIIYTHEQLCYSRTTPININALNTKDNIVHFSREDEEGQTLMSRMALLQQFEIVKAMLMAAPIRSQFNPKQLGRVLLYVLIHQQFELAKMLVSLRPDCRKNFYSSTHHHLYPLHFVILSPNIELSLIKLLCESSPEALLHQKNAYGLSALTLAICEQRDPIVDYFLSQAKLMAAFHPEDLGIALLYLLKSHKWRLAHQLLHRRPDLNKNQVQQKAVLKELHYHTEAQRPTCINIIKNLIDQCTSSQEIEALIKQLEENEDEEPFLQRQKASICCSLTFWKGYAVSEEWTNLIQHAKNKIKSLNEPMQNDNELIKTSTGFWANFCLFKRHKTVNLKTAINQEEIDMSYYSVDL